jgi:hypothetical protein
VKPTSKVLLFDFAMGFWAVVLGSWLTGPSLDGPTVLLFGVSAFGIASLVYTSEHGLTPAVLDDEFVAIGLLIVIPFAMVLGLVLLPPAFTTAFGELFVGAGIGLIGYRFEFGVRREIPETRLEQARSEPVV